MTLSGTPPIVIAYIVFSVLPAIVGFGILAAVARARSAQLWLVPGWVAVAGIGPVLAAFFGVRQIISVFGALAINGGGVGAVSAGMWEAMQPSLFAGYVACVLSVIVVIIALRAVINGETPASRSPIAPAIVSLSLLLLTAIAVASSTHLYQHLHTTIIDVIDPHGPPMAGVAQTSEMLARHLTRAALFAAASVLVLIATVVVTAVMDPKSEPSRGLGLFLTFASVVGVIGLAFNLISIMSWCSRLQQTALTGQVVR